MKQVFTLFSKKIMKLFQFILSTGIFLLFLGGCSKGEGGIPSPDTPEKNSLPISWQIQSVKKISKALNMNHSSVSHALLYDNRSPMFMKKLSDLIGEDLMWLATGDVGKWN